MGRSPASHQPAHERFQIVPISVVGDEACRRNPWSTAIGASIQDDRGKELGTVSQLLGEGTNNIAEYRTKIEGLKKARSLGATEIELRMGNQLVVKQIDGRYLQSRTLP